MFQFHLDTRDDGAVYPLLGRCPTGIMHHRTEITLCQAHLLRKETYLVFLCGILVDKIYETVEDGLFTLLRSKVQTHNQ